jgi:hypothetical protein
MTAGQIPATPVDWDGIGRRMADEMRKMVHEEGFYGSDETRYAQALRRALGDQPDSDILRSHFGLTTEAYARRDLKGAVALAEMHREQAEQQVKEMRAEVARVYREAAGDLAAFLRARCNERTVPSKYRRDGVAWAADMIDPSVPKDQYGNLVEPAGSAS